MNKFEISNKEVWKKNIDVTLIFIMGFFFRFYRLGTLHGGLHRDEATVAMNSFTFFHGGTDFVGNVNPVYMQDWGDGHSALYVWLTQLPLLLNKGHFSPFVSRFPQAFVASLTVLAVYFIAKEMFGRKCGVWAMLFLAVCPWHVSMARWGLDANLAPGFLMFSIYFLVKSVKNSKYYIGAGILFGLTLYSYALTWVVVPLILFSVGIYFLIFKKMHFDRYLVIGIVFLFIFALPQMLFLLVDYGVIGDIRLPFITIGGMNNTRENEVFNGLEGVVTNLKQAIHLFVFQDSAGEVWVIRKPWGLFFDIGRAFIVLGGIVVLVRAIKSFIKRTFAWESVFLFIVLSCASTCLLTFPHVHRINVLYIPLILCGAYGIYFVSEIIGEKRRTFRKVYSGAVATTFLVYFVLFWRDYCTDYKDLVETYWGIGVEDCIYYAMDVCENSDIKKITVEKAAQWPKFLLYTGTTSEEFMQNPVFESYPIPWSFQKNNGITIQTRIDYESVSDDSVFIIYFTDYDVFKENFDLTQFRDWYVAVPKTYHSNPQS